MKHPLTQWAFLIAGGYIALQCLVAFNYKETPVVVTEYFQIEITVELPECLTPEQAEHKVAAMYEGMRVSPYQRGISIMKILVSQRPLDARGMDGSTLYQNCHMEGIDE